MKLRAYNKNYRSWNLMNPTLEVREQALNKIAARIEKDCGIKNGAYFVAMALLLIDAKEWKFDRAWLTRVYQAMDIIEHNEELKQLFQEKDELNN